MTPAPDESLDALVSRHRRELAARDEAYRKAMDEIARLRLDLDALAYAVSHDLRAPLRSIDGFSAGLVDILGDDLDAKAADYLRRVRAAARRLGDMIDGLLDLSRVARAPLAPQATDLSALIRSVAAGVGRRHPEPPVLTLPASLDAVVDRTLATRLFEHALDNCCKFAVEGTTPAIDVVVDDTPDGRQYAIRDNGVGFEMAHAGKLFRPFQRVHSAEYPGVGLGLAVIHRIVERHGGRVAIDSRPGAGTTLRFTLPSAAGGSPGKGVAS